MTLKINTTTVADNSGEVDWTRIINVPGNIGFGTLVSNQDYVKGANIYNVSGSGDVTTDTFLGEKLDVNPYTWQLVYNRVLTNCNCVCYC